MQAIYAKREDGSPQLLRRPGQMKLHTAGLVAVMTCPATPPELGPALPQLLPAALHLLLSLKAHEVRLQQLPSATSLLALPGLVLVAMHLLFATRAHGVHLLLSIRAHEVHVRS